MLGGLRYGQTLLAKQPFVFGEDGGENPLLVELVQAPEDVIAALG